MFVDEYQELHNKIVAGDYQGALALLEEMDALGRKQEVRRIKSFMRILLVHLIKREAEQRTTKSWDCSIRNAAEEIQEAGEFLSRDERDALLEAALPRAFRDAAVEVKDGRYSAADLERLVERDRILAQAKTWLGADLS